MTPQYRMPAACITPADQYVKILERKRDAIFQICEGLKTYFTVDIDADIEAIKNPPAMATPYQPTAEMLIQATEDVQALEQQIEEMKVNLSELPEGMRPIAGVAIPMLEHQLRTLRSYRDGLQKAMEASQG